MTGNRIKVGILSIFVFDFSLDVFTCNNLPQQSLKCYIGYKELINILSANYYVRILVLNSKFG